MSISPLQVQSNPDASSPAFERPLSATEEVYAPFRVLDLSGLTPIASGGDRMVFQHPNHPSALVKVVDIDDHIVLNDVSAGNVVQGVNADGETGLYLIDGFGSKQAIPLFAYSKTLNRCRIQRKYKTLRAKLQERSHTRSDSGTAGNS